MQINKENHGTELRIKVSGRLDTSTSPQLENELRASLDGIESLTFDFSQLDYISSAGLRVLLSTQKAMSRQGTMKLCGVKDEIMEIFDMTGFADFLTIE